MSVVAGKAVIGGAGLMRRALSLGAARAFDYALQFLLPVVLTRCLDAASFGEYRLLWLTAGTVMAVITLSVPGSLFYFLPRSDATHKRLFINQTLIFLALAGAIAACVINPWNPWLPGKMQALVARHEIIVPTFLLLWVSASLLDLLPAAEERVRWQALVIIALSALRAIALSLAAILTGDVNVVMIVLVCFVAVKLIAVLAYIEQFHGLRGPWVRPRAWFDQLKHAAPFSAAAALYGLQAQADQWVAVSLFSIALFAAFSVGAVLAPLVTLCRQSVNHAFLPIMSRLQAAGDVAGMLQLNCRANGMVGMLMYPVLALAFVFAEEIVTVVYTAEYVAAAPVMRVYIAGLAALVIDLSGLMLLLREGAFQMRMSAIVLAISVAISWTSAQHLGLAGAAAGSVIAVYIDRIATLRRISERTVIPFAEVQDWRRLGLLLLFAATAGIFAWGIDERYLIDAAPLARVAAGAAVLAAVYGLLCGLFWRFWRSRLSLDATVGKSERVSTC